jgi:[glutamine synthetase] adenylyltransferase / [glutamine synthetase]-adenylyl-L-tyrosine phosphorylase
LHAMTPLGARRSRGYVGTRYRWFLAPIRFPPCTSSYSHYLPSVQDWQRHLVDTVGEDAIEVFLQAETLSIELPDPPRGIEDLGRFLEADGRAATAVRQFRGDPYALDVLMLLGAFSRFGFELASARPGLLWEIVQERQFRQLWGHESMAAHLEAELAPVSEHEHRRNCLARFKQHHYLRLLLADVSGELSFESLVAELSDMTDVIVSTAVRMARDKLSGRYGMPDVGFAVIGMGKLGGRELNYSSDIDLVFIYEDRHKPGSDEDWDCHAYCQRLGAEVIRVLDEPSDHGRMFRVDMRLRPEGDKGELALSLRETVDYYYSVGRAWERQAAIKARPIAGDLALGNRFLGELMPWIFPKEWAWEGLDSARAMRRRIEERAEERNVKTGAGGIRDIEFLAQYFQLSHGGRIPELRLRATMPTLRALADHGLITRSHARELEDHYIWLRTVEHRLQMWQDQQVHDIPAGPVERASFAHRCGFRGATALHEFDARLHAVRSRVRALAERHYLSATRQEDAVLALITLDEPDPELVRTVLGELGFKDLAKAAANVRALATEPFFVLQRSRTERSLTALLPRLLERIAKSPDPDATLANLVRIVSAVGGRATFYDLMAGSPRILRVFVDLAGWSSFIVTLLHDFPGLPDDVVDSLNQPHRRPDALLREARNLVRGLSQPADALRYFQARELATTAVRDLEGLDQRSVNGQLSHLAIAVLSVALERCTAERVREWGVPVEDQRQTRFAILGLGKLGSKELSYASDMDVIFVCDPGGRCPRADKSGEEFWTRVAQEVMRLLGEGLLYSIDPRLRPWGDQGELVTNTAALRQYWSQPRDLWERMAMLRIAHLAGDPTLGEECAREIRATALLSPLPPNAAADVRDMRHRLEESVAGRDHLKRGVGGYVDHEFIAHYLSFGVHPERLPAASPIGDTISALGALGYCPKEAVDDLAKGLSLLRFAEARMRLTAGKAVSSIPQGAIERSELARRCQFADLVSFDLALHLSRESARKWFERLVV